MHKFWNIFAHEIVTLVWRPSYWIGVVGIPLLSILVYGMINFFTPPGESSESFDLPDLSSMESLQTMQSLDSLKELVNPTEDTSLPIGFVDLAGVTQLVPEEVEPAMYARFASQEEAQLALEQGLVRAFYLFPADFIRSGQVLYFAEALSITRALALDASLNYWVRYNLAGGDLLALDAVYRQFIIINETNLDPANAPRFNILESDSLFSMLMVVYFLAFLLLLSSGMMFTSFNNESGNRVMEVMLVSTSAEQVLWGKFAALTLVGLAQIVLWVAGMAAFGAQASISFDLQALRSITPELVGWTVLFSSLSFLLYGTLMMGLATVFPYLREVAQMLSTLLLPLFLPLVLLVALPQTPNHWLLVIVSLFPLTAPTAILLRMMIIDVPLWQPILSASLLLVSALGTVRFLARNFQPAHLLSTRKFNWFKREKAR